MGPFTYTGKDIAYQLWKLGQARLDFHYRSFETTTTVTSLWSTQTEPEAPELERRTSAAA
jgi:arginyl-tRNA synthetase